MPSDSNPRAPARTSTSTSPGSRPPSRDAQVAQEQHAADQEIQTAPSAHPTALLNRSLIKKQQQQQRGLLNMSIPPALGGLGATLQALHSALSPRAIVSTKGEHNVPRAASSMHGDEEEDKNDLGLHASSGALTSPVNLPGMPVHLQWADDPQPRSGDSDE